MWIYVDPVAHVCICSVFFLISSYVVFSFGKMYIIYALTRAVRTFQKINKIKYKCVKKTFMLKKIFMCLKIICCLALSLWWVDIIIPYHLYVMHQQNIFLFLFLIWLYVIHLYLYAIRFVLLQERNKQREKRNLKKFNVSFFFYRIFMMTEFYSKPTNKESEHFIMYIVYYKTK